MQNKKKIWIGAGITLVMIAFIIVAVINHRQDTTASSNEPPRRALAVQVEEVKKDTIISTVNTNGHVDVKNKQAVYVSSPVRVEEVLVELGENVKQDQLLIVYDGQSKRDLEFQLKQARLQLEQQEIQLENSKRPARVSEIAQAELSVTQAQRGVQDAQNAVAQLKMSIAQMEDNLSDTKKTVENNKSLYKHGAISLAEVERAEQQVASLKKQLEMEKSREESTRLAIESAIKQEEIANDNLKLLINRLSDTEVLNQIRTVENQIAISKLQIDDLQERINRFVKSTKSPMAGSVITLNATEGAYVNQNVPVIEIANIDSLTVTAYVSEYDAPTIAVGQEVKLRGDSLGRTTYKGEVSRVAPTAITHRSSGGEEVVVEIEIMVLAQDTLLKPGYTIEAEIITAYKEDIVVLPILSVLRDRGGEEIVYVVKDDFTLERRLVQTGAYADLYVEAFGVEAGETIVSNPTPRIQEGIAVRPIPNRMSGDNE